MEITPRFEGYWTQLVRTVNVGRPNRDLEKIHSACLEAIKKGLGQVKPGRKVRDIVSAMEEPVKKAGYLLRPPIGHLCGVDLLEARVSQQNETILDPGMAIIIHPTLFTSDSKRSFFCGETYLVTPEGFERLHQSTDQLLTVEEGR